MAQVLPFVLMAVVAAAVVGGSLYVEHRRTQLATSVAVAAGLHGFDDTVGDGAVR